MKSVPWQMRFLVLVLAVMIVTCTCAIGCGSADTPTSVANSIIASYRAGSAPMGRTYFMNPGMYDEFVEMIPDATTMRVANENNQDASNATVDILFGLKDDAGGFTLVMSKMAGGWKVITYMLKEG